MLFYNGFFCLYLLYYSLYFYLILLLIFIKINRFYVVLIKKENLLLKNFINKLFFINSIQIFVSKYFFFCIIYIKYIINFTFCIYIAIFSLFVLLIEISIKRKISIYYIKKYIKSKIF